MKLKDLLKESTTRYKSMGESDEKEKGMTNEEKREFLKGVSEYKKFGESIYRTGDLAEVYESIKGIVETAHKVTLQETGDWFDKVTVGRHMKSMNESFKVFSSTIREVNSLQQRLESCYDEMGEVLGKYYEIKEGNEFGAERAKAIAKGKDEFEVDGKKFPVKDVDKEDKENAKDFAKESVVSEGKIQDVEKLLKDAPIGSVVTGGGYKWTKHKNNSFKTPKGTLGHAGKVASQIAAFKDFKIDESTTAGITIKLTDLLNEDVYVKNKKTGNTYSVKKANPANHVEPSKGDIEKAKSDTTDEPKKDEPKKDEPKNDEPAPNSVSGVVSGDALNYAAEALGKIVPKSEDGVKYNDEFNKIKSERAQIEKDMDANRDNYIKSKGGDPKNVDWDTIDGGLSGWSDSEEGQKTSELRKKLQDGSDEYLQAKDTKDMQNFIDLIDGSPEELQKKFDGVMKEVNKLKDAASKLTGTDLEDAEFAQSQLALSVGVLKYKMNPDFDNDRALLNHYKEESNSYDVKYSNKLDSRNKNESVNETYNRFKKLANIKQSFENRTILK